MSASFDFPTVDRLTVGTIGRPGKRQFFFQARMGAQIVTLKAEKAQVGVLCERLSALLRDNPPIGVIPDPSSMSLEEPVTAQWSVGEISLTFDPAGDVVVLVLEEFMPEGISHGKARFGATRAQMAALAMRGSTLVSAGRPNCELCGYPLDPAGHICPKKNGHRPPRL